MESLFCFQKWRDNMFDKEYIVRQFDSNDMISLVSKLRTQFSLVMIELYFFQIFFEALNTININGTTTESHYPCDGGIKTDCYIVLSNGTNLLKCKYDPYELSNKIYSYNQQ